MSATFDDRLRELREAKPSCLCGKPAAGWHADGTPRCVRCLNAEVKLYQKAVTP